MLEGQTVNCYLNILHKGQRQTGIVSFPLSSPPTPFPFQFILFSPVCSLITNRIRWECSVAMETSEIVTMSTVGSAGSVRLGSLCSPVERISGSSNFFTVVRSLYSGVNLEIQSVVLPKTFNIWTISISSSQFASNKDQTKCLLGDSYICSNLLVFRVNVLC